MDRLNELCTRVRCPNCDRDTVMLRTARAFTGCGPEVSPQLIGMEGKRVTVETLEGERYSFIVAGATQRGGDRVASRVPLHARNHWETHVAFHCEPQTATVLARYRVDPSTSERPARIWYRSVQVSS